MNLKKFFYETTFQDSRNKIIYFNHINNLAYRIPKEKESLFKAFQNRALGTLSIFILLYAYKFPVIITALIVFLFYVGTTGYFQYKLLPTFNTVNNFNLEDAQTTLKNKTPSKIIVLITSYMLSVAVITYLAIVDKDQLLIIVAIVYTLFSLYKIIQSLLLLKTKQSN